MQDPLDDFDAGRPGDHLADLGGAVAGGGERSEQRRHRGGRHGEQQASRGLGVEEDLALRRAEAGPVRKDRGDVALVGVGAAGADALAASW
jgi:hypothetical protein